MNEETNQPSAAFSLVQLRDLAANGRETIRVYEGGTWLSVLLWVLAASCVVPAVAMLAFSRQGGLWSAFVVLLVGIAFGMLGRMFSQRRKVPFLTLSAQGLHYADLTQPIPWAAIENYRVASGSHRFENLILFVELCEDYAIPLKSKKLTSTWYSVRRAWYNAKENWVILKVPGVRGMTNPDLIEQLSTYWRAGLARAQLAPTGDSLVS